MGAYLNTPVMAKEIEEGENEFIRFAAASMQGWRVHQEDAHNAILDFDTDCSLFAVYDGHGGSEVATYIAQNFPEFLKECRLLQSDDVKEAIKKSFLDFDRTLSTDKVIGLMNAFKEGEKTPASEKSDDEEKEVLFEEAMALSKEANLSLDTIIKQYTKISRKLQDEGFITEVTKTEKRALGEPSSRLVKRRRVQRENATVVDGVDENLEEETPIEQVNGKEKISECGDVSMECDSKNATPQKTDLNNQNGVNNESPQKPVGSFSPEANKIGVSEENTSEMSVNKSSQSSSKDDLIGTEEDAEEEEDSDYSVAEDDEVDAAEDSEESDEDEPQIPMSFGQNKPGYDSGATACLTLLFKDKVIVANVGDSRAVLCRDGKAVDLSVDHKPEDAKEKGRIEAAGGKVSDDGRVNGGLNLSRALGDHFYKQNADINLEDQMITPMPDVEIANLTDKDTLLVVACDGIWNSMSSQEVLDYINERIETMPLKDIGAEICSHCCAPDTSGDGTGCDNMTIIILDLVKNQRANLKSTSEPETKSQQEMVADEKPETVVEEAK